MFLRLLKARSTFILYLKLKFSKECANGKNPSQGLQEGKTSFRRF